MLISPYLFFVLLSVPRFLPYPHTPFSPLPVRIVSLSLHLCLDTCVGAEVGVCEAISHSLSASVTLPFLYFSQSLFFSSLCECLCVRVSASFFLCIFLPLAPFRRLFCFGVFFWVPHSLRIFSLFLSPLFFLCWPSSFSLPHPSSALALAASPWGGGPSLSPPHISC